MKISLFFCLWFCVFAAPLWASDLTQGGPFEAQGPYLDQGLFEENYILPLTERAKAPQDGRTEEIQFRFSLYQKVELAQQRFYVAFTQTSFWQAYDLEHSRPFRETNYNPELFWATNPLEVLWNPWLHLGFEHESNGGREPYSRSWNRIYARLGLAGDHWKLRHKFFWRLSEPAKQYPLDPKGDENPEIVDYYGLNEMELVWTDEQKVWQLHGRFRYNLSKTRGASELNLTYPVGMNGTFLTLQYFQGYGESLSDYNHQVSKVGLGFSLNRP